MDGENLDDRQWLIFRAKSNGCDTYAAKTWMLVAKSLFPDDFNIQYEAYELEKAQKNFTEAGKLIHDMYTTFPKEKKLWEEIQNITEALHSEIENDDNKFYQELFGSMPSSLQGEMVLQIADRTQDILGQCRLMLLVLKRYPQQMIQQGVQLLESLLSTEKHSHLQSPVNCYRKYFAYDILPLVLRGNLADNPSKRIHRWIQKAIEFYICYIAQPPAPQEIVSSPQEGPGLQSPSRKVKKPLIPGLPDKDSLILQPWDRLFELMRMAGRQLDWSLKDLFTSTSRDAQFQYLSSLNHRVHREDRAYKQVLLCGCVLMFEALHHYCSRMDPHNFIGGGVSPAVPLVLLDSKAVAGDADSSPKQKKLKTEVKKCQIISSKSVSGANAITESFLMAVKCWEMLHSSELSSREFNQLCSHWHTDNWTWLNNFQIDMLIYQGQVDEAMKRLQASSASLTGLPKIRAELQVASCQYSTGYNMKLVEGLLQVVCELSHSTDSNLSANKLQKTSSGRNLLLMTLSEHDILPFCIQALTNSLKAKAFMGVPNDAAIGHMLVLLQYDWPSQEDLVLDLMHRIQTQGSFRYSLFFNFIINLDILEEVAYLKSTSGGKINLDILPTQTKVAAQQRTVTRGVKKGVKEDFKLTLEKQITRCQENPLQIIHQFITEEADEIKSALLGSQS